MLAAMLLRQRVEPRRGVAQSRPLIQEARDNVILVLLWQVVKVSQRIVVQLVKLAVMLLKLL